jgi:hypothetical protein
VTAISIGKNISRSRVVFKFLLGVTTPLDYVVSTTTFMYQIRGKATTPVTHSW